MILKDKRIFIVEDNMQNRLIFQMALIRQGASVDFETVVTLLSVPQAASAQGRCKGVDLRVPGLIRPQSQIFTDADGKETDSGMCASFSSSLLVSQKLGIAVNPVDMSFRSALSILSRTDKELKDTLRTGKYEGYCRQAAVDAYLGEKRNNFTQAFNDFVHRLNPSADGAKYSELSASDLQKVAEWLNHICGERIQDSTVEHLHVESADESNPDYNLMNERELGEELDRWLDRGRLVQYTHGYHAVTIVGRTKECGYIIQDSIPQSSWEMLGGLLSNSQEVYKGDVKSALTDQAQVTFEGQHFQYWPRDILLRNAQRIEHVQ